MESETVLPVCYRHPDRETRLACTACERPICVDCMIPAPVGQRCRECAAPSGGRRLRRQDRSPVSTAVLAVAVGLFVGGMFVPELGQWLFLAFGQHNLSVLAGDTYRILTAGFLHAGLTHVLFNMWALWVFGPQLEREVGSGPFAGLYLASLLWGGTAYLWLGAPGGFAVGASGAIFGLFGAWTAVSLRNRHTMVGQAQLRQMGVLLVVNAALPLIAPNIAWQAHLGGFVAGFLVALAWTALRGAGAAGRLRAAVAFGAAALAWVAALAA